MLEIEERQQKESQDLMMPMMTMMSQLPYPSSHSQFPGYSSSQANEYNYNSIHFSLTCIIVEHKSIVTGYYVHPVQWIGILAVNYIYM